LLKPLLLAFVLIAVSVAQPDSAWLFTYPASKYGESQPLAAFVDDTGNVYVAGWSEKKADRPDILLLKIDSFGHLVWARTYDNVTAVGASRDTAGNIYIAGSSTDTAERRLYVLKYSPHGDTQWVRTYGGEHRSFATLGSMAFDDSQNVYACGQSESASCAIVRILRYSPSGVPLVTMSYTVSRNLSLSHGYFHILANGDAYLALNIAHPETGCGKWLTVKLSRQGQILWERIYKDTDSTWERPQWSQLDEKASIYLTGVVVDRSDILKMDSSGNIVWVREFKSPENNPDEPPFLFHRKGETYLAGWVLKDKVSTDQTRIVIVKYDSLGNELWASQWGGADTDAYPGYGSNWYEPEARPEYCSMNVDDSGNVYVTGWFDYLSSGRLPLSYGFAAVLLKYDSRGNRVWVRKLPERKGEMWAGAVVGLDNRGAIYEVGMHNMKSIYVLKYRTR